MTRDADPDAPAEAWVGPLPEAVRQRVVALASATLSELPAAEVPAPLRPFARFTASRRARLAASALAATLDGDAAFRLRVGERLRKDAGELVNAVIGGQPPAAADPVEVAVAAYLFRPPEWEKVVGGVRDAVDRTVAAETAEREAENVARLRDQLTKARAEAREERDKLRAELARLKEENQSLRRTLHGARDTARRAEAESTRLTEEAERVRTEADARASRSDAELRRLRSKLAEAEATVEAGRRAVRDARDVEVVRLRLLVDTLVEAAQGLSRELALPPVTELPADSVPAIEPAAPTARDAGGGRRGGTDATLLGALLTLPRIHLVVDGYNVTKSAWPKLPLQAQRERLVGALGELVARTGAETTCVFDGADLNGAPAMNVPRGVRVRFSPSGVTADDVIAMLVAAEPTGRPMVVVSSDREVMEASRRSGAQTVDATALMGQLGAG